MLEVVFGQSAEGSLKYAQHCGDDSRPIGSVVCAVIGSEGGNTPPEKEMKRWQTNAQKEATAYRKRAVSLGGDLSDVFCFGSDYSIGDISQNGLSQNHLDSEEFYTSSCDQRKSAKCFGKLL